MAELRLMALMVRVEDPRLVRVATWGTPVSKKVRAEVLKPAVAMFPESGMMRGELGSLLGTRRLAVRLPAAVGVKAMVRVQVADVASGDGQVSMKEKSPGLDPARLMVPRLAAAPPLLLMVIV